MAMASRHGLPSLTSLGGGIFSPGARDPGEALLPFGICSLLAAFLSDLGHGLLDLRSLRSILDQRSQAWSLCPRWAASAGFPTIGHAGYALPTFGTTGQSV